MSDDLIRSIYDYPQYYPVTSPGCEGDIQFYIEEMMASGSPVLEIGCGTGRTLIPIAESGAEIVGIDNSEHMLQVCRDIIAKKGKAITLRQLDMCSLDYEETFKTVILPYRTFLSLHTVKEQLDCLAGIHHALVPGGKLILNIFDPDFTTLAEFCKIGSSFRMFRQGVVPETGKDRRRNKCRRI